MARRKKAESGARKTRRGSASLATFRGGASLFGGSKGTKWNIKVKGVESLLRKYKLMPKIVGYAMLEAVRDSLLIVQIEAKKLILDGYYRPAYDTGKLYNSIKGHITSFDLFVVQGEVGTKVYYSIYVHEGTWFMKERAFLKDALDNKKARIVNKIKKAIKKDLKRTIL